MKSETKDKLLKQSLIALFVFILVTITAKCSFLYKMNYWVDPNCYFTVARAMKKGFVLYRDIYEQKGPYVYFLHYIAVSISDGYLGMWIFEVIAGLIVACFAYKLLSLYIENDVKKIIYLLIFLSFYYTSPAFRSGDSVEEMSIPFLLIAFYFLAKSIKNNAPMPFYQMMIIGALSGIIFFSKYTICGMIFAIALMTFIWDIKDKRTKKAFLEIVYFFTGFILALLPALIYFKVNDSLSYFWEAYFYNNIFLYSSEKKSFIVKIGLALLGYFTSYINLCTTYLLIIPGFIFAIKDKRTHSRLFVTVLVVYIITVLFLFGGGVYYRYYGLPTVVFGLFGIISIDKHGYKMIKIADIVKRHGKKLLLLFIPFELILIFAVGENNYFMFRKKTDYAEINVANKVNEYKKTHGDVSVYNYGCLDCGIYNLTNLTPPNKYFCKLNVPLKEMYEVQDETLKNGEVTFVLAKNLNANDISERVEGFTDKYELYYSEESPDYYSFVKYRNNVYYLYKLKEA